MMKPKYRYDSTSQHVHFDVGAIAPNNGPVCTGTGNAPDPSYYAKKGTGCIVQRIQGYFQPLQSFVT